MQSTPGADISPIAGVVVRTAIVYAAVLAGIRLTGKREGGQCTPFAPLFVLLISNAVQNAMTGPDTCLPSPWRFVKESDPGRQAPSRKEARTLIRSSQERSQRPEMAWEKPRMPLC